MPDAPKTFVQTVIVIDTTGGNFTVAASQEFGAVCKAIGEALAENRHVTFTAPVTGRRVLVSAYALGQIVSIFEQEVQIVNDPRAVGQDRTASGILVPR